MSVSGAPPARSFQSRYASFVIGNAAGLVGSLRHRKRMLGESPGGVTIQVFQPDLGQHASAKQDLGTQVVTDSGDE